LDVTSPCFDIRTDRGVAAVRTPRCKDAADFGEHPLQVGRFFFEQCADMSTWRGPRATQRNDVRDVGKRQAEATSLSNERQPPQHISIIVSVARGRALSRR